MNFSSNGSMNSPLQAEDHHSPQQANSFDVLIVDDVPDNIRFLSSFLMEQGYRVRKAVTGQMALVAIKTLMPDLILLDVNLPDLSGHKVCHQLKADPITKSIPIIFLSAGNEAIDKVRAFQMGAADYITKPFYLEEVLVRIQTQLTIQKLQQELNEQNEQLKVALDDLKIAQTNLVHQEKMATLKKVVAGVTHEINNPLSFIACNIAPAKEHVQQLLDLIHYLSERNDITSDPDIQSGLDEIDLDFVASDLINILSSMENGADRIRTVVLALRFFTRLDESGVKEVNVNENIEYAIALFQHRLRPPSEHTTIQVEKDYGVLPAIIGQPEQLNQVLFNLISNAIDAIAERICNHPDAEFSPKLSIRTRSLDPETISIHIQDNGIGIPDANQNSIFEPFFTTKPAGQGIGLGLAISRRIVEEGHRGHLSFTSSSLTGTEFVITLPVSSST
jgi:signal transduction histidine kinase